jgi:hypothetical protein
MRKSAGCGPNAGLLRENDMMVALQDLFMSDVGLLSVFTIAFILVMGVYIYRYAMTHMHDEEIAVGHPPAKPSSGA